MSVPVRDRPLLVTRWCLLSLTRGTRAVRTCFYSPVVAYDGLVLRRNIVILISYMYACTCRYQSHHSRGSQSRWCKPKRKHGCTRTIALWMHPYPVARKRYIAESTARQMANYSRLRRDQTTSFLPIVCTFPTNLMDKRKFEECAKTLPYTLPSYLDA